MPTLRSSWCLLLMLSGFMAFDLDSSCCSSASTAGVSRLLPHERATIEMTTTSRYRYGSFDQGGRLKMGWESHLPYLLFEPQLQIQMRLLDFFEPFLIMPARIQISHHQSGANPADMTAGARIPLLPENFLHGWPSFALAGSLNIPSGVAFDADEKTGPEFVTSTGDWLLKLMAMIERSLGNNVFGLGYGLAFDPAHTSSSDENRVLINSFFLSAARNISNLGNIAVSIASEFHKEAPNVPGSDRRRCTMGLSYSLDLHSHIKLKTQVSYDIPIDLLGKNFDSELSLGFGLRMGVF